MNRIRCLVGFLLVALLIPSSRHCVIPSCQAADDDERKAGELVQVLRNKNSKLDQRRAAVIALGLLGPKVSGVLKGLMEAVEKDKEADVRVDAADTLGQMGPAAREAVETLVDVLRSDKEMTVRRASAT